MAQNEAYQYGQPGSTSAITRGEMADRRQVESTIQYTGARWRITPSATLKMMPRTTFGMKRSDVCSAERSCTFWKLSWAWVSSAIVITED